MRRGARRRLFSFWSLSPGIAERHWGVDHWNMDAAHRSGTAAGLSRLAEHCESLGRLLAGETESPRLRLEAELGSELAHRLVGALLQRAPRLALLL